MSSRALEARLAARARELGFVACGVADLAPSRRGDALDRWLAGGFGGTMRYLHRQAKKRKAPASIVEGARTAVVVLDNYYTPDPEPYAAPRVAKYARGADYHRVTQDRLEQLAEWLRGEGGAQVTRCFADAGPVPERELAERAGLGWIGKNAMLIRPGVGSFCFIGSIFTDLRLVPDEPLDLDRCGSCTRCLDACPTEAFVAPRVLDATRCISYLTIEQKGPIPDELVPRLEGWAYGCDICNDVCPWNQRFAEETGVAEFRPGPHLAAVEEDLVDAMDEEEFAARFAGTAFERAGLHGLRRNLRAVTRP
jgi:epoxyqueuosine reductase